VAGFSFGLFAGFWLLLIVFKEGSADCIFTGVFNMLHLFHCNLINPVLSWFLHFFRTPKFLVD
jgi:hypothetical protein